MYHSPIRIKLKRLSMLNIGSFLKKNDPVILLPGICPREMKPRVHRKA